MTVTDLAVMRADNHAVWNGSVHGESYRAEVIAHTSTYLPVLEDAYDAAVARTERLAVELAWACEQLDRLVGESLTKLNARGRARMLDAMVLAAGGRGVDVG